MSKRSRLRRKSGSSVSVKTSNSVNNGSDCVGAEQNGSIDAPPQAASDTWYNNLGSDFVLKAVTFPFSILSSLCPSKVHIVDPGDDDDLEKRNDQSDVIDYR